MTKKADKKRRPQASGRKSPASPVVTVTHSPAGMDRSIIEAAQAALRSRRFTKGSLHVAVISDARMRREHARWMNDDEPTDVLTFDLRDDAVKGLVDGELLVCSAVARERARGYGGDWRAELLLYVVHGCMHLCGYDDHEPAEAAEMHRLEDRVLKKLGWGEVFAAESRADREKIKGRAAPRKSAAGPRSGLSGKKGKKK